MGDITFPFLSALSDLVLLGKSIEGKERQALFVFGVACAIIAVLMVVAEICVYQIFNKSMMSLPRHSWRYTTCLFLTVPTICAITGMFALALDILQPSRAGFIAAGLSWPAIILIITGRSINGDAADDDTPSEDEGKAL